MGGTPPAGSPAARGGWKSSLGNAWGGLSRGQKILAGATVVGSGTLGAQNMADRLSGNAPSSTSTLGNPQRGSKNDPTNPASGRSWGDLTGEGTFWNLPEKYQTMRDAMAQSGEIDPDTNQMTPKLTSLLERDGYYANGNWTSKAAQDGIVHASKAGQSASWMDMRSKGTTDEPIAEATPEDVAGTSPIRSKAPQSSGTARGVSWQGGNTVGSWHGGDRWQGGSGNSGGFWSGLDFDAFFEPDFIGRRFGWGGNFHDFLEDLDGDGKLDSSEFRAAKRKARRGGKSMKSGRFGTTKKSGLGQLKTNSPIRADILAALEEETGRRHGGWPEGRK